MTTLQRLALAQAQVATNNSNQAQQLQQSGLSQAERFRFMNSLSRIGAMLFNPLPVFGPLDEIAMTIKTSIGAQILIQLGLHQFHRFTNRTVHEFDFTDWQERPLAKRHSDRASI